MPTPTRSSIVRAVFQQGHRELEATPATFLLPRKGVFGLIDYEKVFTPDPREEDIFDARAIDRDATASLVVRPDQYVAHVLPLDAHGRWRGSSKAC